MSSTKRKLLLFHAPSLDKDIYHQALEPQWSVYFAENIQQASELLTIHSFRVGLCLIDTNECRASKRSDAPCKGNICDGVQQLTLLNRLFNSHTDINWIMGLPKACIPEIVHNSTEYKLIAEHCYDYITYPVNTEQLLFVLGHAFGMNEIFLASQKLINDYPPDYGVVGKSSAMISLVGSLKKAAKEDCPVLIAGETGTGKELVANAIHNHSSRSKQPFVAVNCGTFTKELVQSELFGYEKGSFTGAHQRKIGRIESAHNGTLFLDEIGDLPIDQQINLLRFLEEKTIERIGGTEKIAVDVRVITATHVDLKEAVRQKRFREDLYYRLRVLQIKTPPLRERENDIELLAWYFFDKFSANQTYKAKGFHPDSLYLLCNYEWPGNVRELMNSIRHAIVTSENRLLTPADLGLDRRYSNPGLQTLDQARATADRETIFNTLRQTKFNMSRTAETLGISRVSLYRLIEKYRLNLSPNARDATLN